MIEVSDIYIQNLGVDREFNLLKITYYEICLKEDGTKDKTTKRGVILRIRPEDLFQIAEGCEYPHFTLRPKDLYNG